MRPITEVFYDRDFGEARTRSALIDRYGRSKTISLSILHYVVHALTSILLSRYADSRAGSLYDRMLLLRLIGAFLGGGIGVPT